MVKSKQNKQISNNILLALLLLTIMFSLVGTWVSLSKLSALVGYAITPAPTGIANVSVNSTVSISCNMTICLVQFLDQNPEDVNDTMDNAPQGFNLTNDGSVRVNISVRKNVPLFNGTGGDTNNFQMNATCLCFAPRCCGNWTNIPGASWTSNWIDITTSNKQMVDRLNFTDGSDVAEIEIRISVPNDEPSGTRTSTLTFTATAGD